MSVSGSRQLRLLTPIVAFMSASLVALPAFAQLTDQTQTPNAINAGIAKSLNEQVENGRGDIFTPGSSVFIIKRDPFRAIRRGRQIFQRKFQVSQGFGPRTNDGVGDIAADASLGAGLVDSCAGCHGRPRGSAGHGGNVVTRPDSRDAPHLFGLGLQEMLADEITSDLRELQAAAMRKARESGSSVSVRLESKGIRYGHLTAHPDGTVDTSDVKGVDPDLRVKPFFAEGSVISMRQFAVGAFNAEMGLESPDPVMAAAANGEDVTTPSGMELTGSLDEFGPPPVSSEFEDSDEDGVTNEVPPALIDHMEFYLLNYFRPGRYLQNNVTEKGEEQFRNIGCARCHRPDLKIENDRRVADVETSYDPDNGAFNNLFAQVSARFVTVDDGSNFPDKKLPQGGEFLVEDIFTDFRRHDLGPNFWERNFDGTVTKKFMTEPLWGVGSTAPYGHDGRSINLNEVILRHGGEAQRSRDAYADLNANKKAYVLAFLQSLVLFPPDDTASNLNPADPSDPLFPQVGHGSIALGGLFNDPSEPE